MFFFASEIEILENRKHSESCSIAYKTVTVNTKVSFTEEKVMKSR